MTETRLAFVTRHLQAWMALYAAAGQIVLSLLVLSQRLTSSFIQAPYVIVISGWLLTVVAINYPWEAKTALTDSLGQSLRYRKLSRKIRIGLTAAATMTSILTIAGVYYLEHRLGTPRPLPSPFSSNGRQLERSPS